MYHPRPVTDCLSSFLSQNPKGPQVNLGSALMGCSTIPFNTAIDSNDRVFLQTTYRHEHVTESDSRPSYFNLKRETQRRCAVTLSFQTIRGRVFERLDRKPLRHLRHRRNSKMLLSPCVIIFLFHSTIRLLIFSTGQTPGPGVEMLCRLLRWPSSTRYRFHPWLAQRIL